MRNIFLILPFFLLAGCVAQTGLQNEVSSLRTDVETKEKDLRFDFANLRSELDGLRSDLQVVQGSIEETTYTAASGQKSTVSEEILFLKESLLQLSTRVQELSDYVGFETAAVKEGAGDKVSQAVVAPPVASNPVSPTAPADADTSYAAAKLAFDNGDFESAQKGFEEILTKFPESDKAGNAQFWLGEIYYRGNWYEKAILEYQKVLDNYPKDNKVASALLKQGLAFEKLGQNANARVVLDELVQKFPGSSEALIAQKKIRQL